MSIKEAVPQGVAEQPPLYIPGLYFLSLKFLKKVLNHCPDIDEKIAICYFRRCSYCYFLLCNIEIEDVLRRICIWEV